MERASVLTSSCIIVYITFHFCTLHCNLYFVFCIVFNLHCILYFVLCLVFYTALHFASPARSCQTSSLLHLHLHLHSQFSKASVIISLFSTQHSLAPTPVCPSVRQKDFRIFTLLVSLSEGGLSAPKRAKLLLVWEARSRRNDQGLSDLNFSCPCKRTKLP